MPAGWLIMFVVLLIRFMIIDGTWTEFMFQVAAINKPLVSVSKLNESGYWVVFDEDKSYILHKKTKKVIHMRKERGVFMIDAYVAKKPSQGFKGQRRSTRLA